MQDYDFATYSSTCECLAHDWAFYRKFVEDCVAIWIQPEVGSKLATILGDAGFETVGEKMYRVPMCRDSSIPEGDLLADHNFQSRGIASSILTMVSGSRRSKEEIEEIGKEMDKHVWACGVGEGPRFFVVTGRKPASF